MKPTTFKLLVLSIFASFFMTSCGEDHWGIKGEGPVIEGYRTADNYDEIDLAVPATLYLQQGQQEDIRIEAQENILDNIETYIQGDRLRIRFDRNVRSHGAIRIYIQTPHITALSVSGSGAYVGTNKIETPALAVSISGSGDVTLDVETEHLMTSISGSGESKYSGVADMHNIAVSGSGKVESLDLVSENADVQVSGSGDVFLWVTERLDAQVSGSGNVLYKGNPRTVNSHVSGSGKVKPL